ELLHTKKRKDDTIEQIQDVLENSILTIDIELVGPEITGCSQASSFLPAAITEDDYNLELPDSVRSGTLRSDYVSITMDNLLSPAHTLVQIMCQDHKGLLYDIMRTIKDYNMKLVHGATSMETVRSSETKLVSLDLTVSKLLRHADAISYGRFTTKPRRKCEIDLFIMQADGKKIVDPNKQNSLSSRFRTELFRPLRVAVVSRGPDIELLVANPVELSGNGRPLVFYDITLALKMLDICIFTVINDLLHASYCLLFMKSAQC
ncbi:amino acid binding protein, partial [Trifolium medium]|nr:amino acid binding protein [Trifolium medium]